MVGRGLLVAFLAFTLGALGAAAGIEALPLEYVSLD